MTASVVIIGAGPSGCYMAQAVAKALPGSRIDIVDRLPVPYGLVRYGVAPDHQGTKAVIRQFERLFERQDVGFFGNVTLGADISLDMLRGLYDIVVLATGLSQDRRLEIPGAELEGVIGSGAITRAWNDHPDSESFLPPVGRNVIVMGNGNVAIDVVRILAKSAEEFEGSDLSPAHAEHLVAAGIETIDVVGRSPASDAKFDAVMIKELAKLSQARIRVIGAGPAKSEQGQKLLDALATVDGSGPDTARRTITFRFGWTPNRLEGDKRVQQAHFSASDGSAATLALPCDNFITAIGFEDDGFLGRVDLLASARDTETGRLADGLYAAGWFRRGPRGTIPENRIDAINVTAAIAADVAKGSLGGKPGRDALKARLSTHVDYAGWRRIDAAELAECAAGRCRAKISSRERMLAIAAGSQERDA